MELFRVGGDVPETNYLFMGMVLLAPRWATRRLTDRQAISSIVASILLSLSFYCYALKYDTPTGLLSYEETTSPAKSRLYMASMMNAHANMAAQTFGGEAPHRNRIYWMVIQEKKK